MKMYYVYVLYSSRLKKKYIGYTQDLRNRIMEHNRKESEFSSKGAPWKLIYYQAFVSKEDALLEEKFLKTGKGRERMKYLFKNYFGGLAESG